jgi:hydrogen peroxide-dependent heme synthase
MSGAPVTLEGWYVLHEMFAVDWPRWNAAAAAERAAAVEEATALLGAQAAPAEGESGSWAVVGHKADVCLVHWRRDLESLRAEQLEWSRTRLRAYLVPAYSYVSVIELGTYELTGHASSRLRARGTEPGSQGWDAALEEEMKKLAAPRLYPKIPARRYLCFYPMSKRRGETVNWFDLPAEERAALMRGHGEIGRRWAGQVTQVIAGSVGLDDWEWGVTLFADDPLVFKKLIYEMRFDPASSRYALFGPFYVGIRFAPSELGGVLRA